MRQPPPMANESRRKRAVPERDKKGRERQELVVVVVLLLSSPWFLFVGLVRSVLVRFFCSSWLVIVRKVVGGSSGESTQRIGKDQRLVSPAHVPEREGIRRSSKS